MTKMLKQLWKDEEGPTAVEYALMLALIAVAIILTVQTLGTEVNSTFKSVSDKL